MSVPVFAINLDRSTDRWQLICDNLDRIGLKATRIVAIDGLSLADDPSTKLLGAGPVACARSHYKAMAAFLKCAAPAALILEDDAIVGTSVPSIIQSLDWWPEGHGLVKMESVNKARGRIWLGRSVGFTPDGRSLHPIVYKHMGGYGYLIDRTTAEQVLAVAPDVPMPIDNCCFTWSIRRSHGVHDRYKWFQAPSSIVRLSKWAPTSEQAAGSNHRGRCGNPATSSV